MGLLDQLRLIDGARVWGIVQCTNKNPWLERLLRDWKKEQQRVVVAHQGKQKLPPSGTIIIGKNIPVVVKEIQDALQEVSQLRIGKRIHHGYLEGFSLKEIHKIARELTAVHFLLELPCEPDAEFLVERQTLQQWVSGKFWDQLIFAIPLDIFLEKLETTRNDESAWKFLSNDLKPLFEQKWPAAIVLSGNRSTREENQVMLLIRDIMQQLPQIKVGVFRNADNTIHWMG